MIKDELEKTRHNKLKKLDEDLAMYQAKYETNDKNI